MRLTAKRAQGKSMPHVPTMLGALASADVRAAVRAACRTPSAPPTAYPDQPHLYRVDGASWLAQRCVRTTR